MKIKDLTTEQLETLFIMSVGVNNAFKDGTFVEHFKEHFGTISVEYQEDRWHVENKIAYIELTESISFRCGFKMFGIRDALLFDIVAAYKCIESFGLIK